MDASHAVVYVAPRTTRYGEQVLLQLTYTIWFPERPPEGAFDALAGRLDGLVWRVTLAPDGEPLLFDSIHPCGCFHQFFPTALARPRPADSRRSARCLTRSPLPTTRRPLGSCCVKVRWRVQRAFIRSVPSR